MEQLRTLHSVAASQGGYFTAKQAKELGYIAQYLRYHRICGHIQRVSSGLYRLPTIPQSKHDALYRLTLWSRDRNDAPQAVISHTTALSLYDLTDVLPELLHATVPRRFRKREPRGWKLHRGNIRDEDRLDWEGFFVTTPLRTLIDVATDHTVTREQVEQACQEAVSRGLVRKAQLKLAAKRAPALNAAVPSSVFHEHQKGRPE